MSLKKLFESVDENVFTPELKQSLEDVFNEAVEAKATEISEAKINEEINSLNVKSEEHIDYLDDKAEEYVNNKKAEMIDSLDKYLDRIVEEFMVEIQGTLDESIKNEKSDLIIEAFESMMIAAGVKVKDIVEARDDSAIETKLAESNKKYDQLIEENIQLNAENEKLFKIGVMLDLGKSPDKREPVIPSSKKISHDENFNISDEMKRSIFILQQDLPVEKNPFANSTAEAHNQHKPFWQ